MITDTVYFCKVPERQQRRVAVRMNLRLNEFLTNMAQVFLRKNRMTLFERPSESVDLQHQHNAPEEHEDALEEQHQHSLLPVELKFVVLSYLSLADMMKALQ